MTNNKVLVGKDDWLFLSNDTNKVIDQITGRFILPDNFGQRWREVFDFRLSLADEVGYKYFFNIIPNKECVYAKYLPDNLSLSENRPVYEIIKSFPSGVEWSYYFEILREASFKQDVFSKGDTHWNYWGALIAFNEFMRKLGFQEISLDQISQHDSLIDGDLSSKIGQKTLNTKLVLKKRNFRVIERNDITNVGQKIVFENDDKKLPTAILFKDSFTSHQLEFFASKFSKLICLWQPNLDLEFIKRERPDFVLQQQVERFLVRIPNDISGPSHLDYVAKKISI